MRRSTPGDDEWSVGSEDNVTYYIRQSTVEQDNEHQLQGIQKWIDSIDADLSVSDMVGYTDTASGATADREGLQALMDDIEQGAVDHVLVWEISRIAREGELAHRFFNICEDEGVVIHATHDNIDRITPDGEGRLVAGIFASIYEDERRTLIRRTKQGQKRAMKAGKWIGKPPLGFTTDDDGYLIANVEFYEGYNDERPGFWAVEAALERLDDGASYRSTASRLGCSRAALRSVFEDDERRRWFEDREADDERVQAALDELDSIEGDQP